MIGRRRRTGGFPAWRLPLDVFHVIENISVNHRAPRLGCLGRFGGFGRFEHRKNTARMCWTKRIAAPTILALVQIWFTQKNTMAT